MPATAGRVRMPANNRVHSSAALQTHGIWQTAIRYDPYAPSKDDAGGNNKNEAQQHLDSSSNAESDNAYASFQGLLELARLSRSDSHEARGACKKCGRVGHLSFQCRNFLSAKVKEKAGEEDDVVVRGLERVSRGTGKSKVVEEESEEEESESESEDSEVDLEIERIIAERSGKKQSGGKQRSERRNKMEEEVDDSDDGSGSDSRERRKRGRSKKRRSKKRVSGSDSDSDDVNEGRRNRMKEKQRRRKRDDSSTEEEEDRRRRKRKTRREKRRRRSHRYSDDSDSNSDLSDLRERRKRKSRRAAASPSDSDARGRSDDDSRVGRGTERSEKSRKRCHEDDE